MLPICASKYSCFDLKNVFEAAFIGNFFIPRILSKACFLRADTPPLTSISDVRLPNNINHQTE